MADSNHGQDRPADSDQVDDIFQGPTNPFPVPTVNHKLTTGPMVINEWFPVGQLIYLDTSYPNRQHKKADKQAESPAIIFDRPLL